MVDIENEMRELRGVSDILCFLSDASEKDEEPVSNYSASLFALGVWMENIEDRLQKQADLSNKA